MIFTFGSNEAGIHGAGAAKYAREFHGAVLGVGVGRTGNSYAIPTKDKYLNPLKMGKIEKYFDDFLTYAISNPFEDFDLVPIGCGLAGFKRHEMLEMMKTKQIPDNVYFNRRWMPGQSPKFR